MKCKNVVDVLNRLAPESLACSWDNVGLSVGRFWSRRGLSAGPIW